MKIKSFSTTVTVFLFSLMLPLFAADSPEGTIIVLHTNDIHAQFVPREIRPRDGQGETRYLGGMLALNYTINKIREETKHVLVLDAGDFMTGNPISEIEYNGAQGGALIHFFNYMKYDGLTPGNHEFDISVQNARKLIDLSEFPIFSANLFTADGELFTDEPYHIYKRGKLSIGVIGVIVDDLEGYLNMPQRHEAITRPALPIVDSLAQVIDPQTDLIIVLSHSGLDADKKLASQLGPEVDIIIGGHSHSRLKETIQLNRKYIVQAGSKGLNLGRMDITVAGDTVQHLNYEMIPLWNEGIEVDPILQKEVAVYENQIKKEYDRVIGELLTPWQREHAAESNIGNYIADCIRDYCDTDFAVINSGGIRLNLDAGPIKKLDIKNILPFNNSLCKFEVSGKELMKIIENNASAGLNKTSGILQVSGLKYEYKKGEKNQPAILSAKVSGKEIELQKIYSGATVDFVLSNGDKYLSVEPKNVVDLMMPLTDVVVQSIEQQKKIDSRIEGRIGER